MPMPPLSDGGIAMPAAERPSGRSARPSGDETDSAARVPPRHHFQADVPQEVNNLPKMAAMGPGLAAIFGNSGNFAMPTAPVRRCARPPGRNGPLLGRMRPSGRAGCAGPEGFRTVLAPGRGPGPDAVAQPSGFPCGEQAPNLEPGHVASKYVVARSVAKCLSDLRTVPVA